MRLKIPAFPPFLHIAAVAVGFPERGFHKKVVFNICLILLEKKTYIFEVTEKQEIYHRVGFDISTDPINSFPPSELFVLNPTASGGQLVY